MGCFGIKVTYGESSLIHTFIVYDTLCYPSNPLSFVFFFRGEMHDFIMNEGVSDPFCSKNTFDELIVQWKNFSRGVLGSNMVNCREKSNIVLWKLHPKIIHIRDRSFGKNFSPLKTDISMKTNIAKISSHFQVVHQGKSFSSFFSLSSFLEKKLRVKEKNFLFDFARS